MISCASSLVFGCSVPLTPFFLPSQWHGFSIHSLWILCTCIILVFALYTGVSHTTCSCICICETCDTHHLEPAACFVNLSVCACVCVDGVVDAMLEVGSAMT